MPIDLGIKSGFILAGGRGERLRPLTDHTPKVMLPVRGKPILQWNIELLARFGVKRVVLGVGKFGGQIEEKIGDEMEIGGRKAEIIYSREKEPLGTGGALKNAQKLLDSETFFMMNGDSLQDFDLAGMLALHRSKHALATLALIPVDDVSGFGVVAMEGEQIKEFVEKPSPDEAPSNLISAGLYLLEPGVFELIPANRAVSIEKGVFPGVASAGKLLGFRASGQWQWFAADDMERYEMAQKQWKGFG